MAGLKYVDEQGREWFVLGEGKTRRLSVRTEEERNALYMQNTGLIFHIVTKNLGEQFRDDALFDDLVQDLRLVMLRALELWRAEDGLLSTYCGCCIARRIKSVLPDMRKRRGGPLDDEPQQQEDNDPEDPWAALYRLLKRLKPMERDLITRAYGLRCDPVPNHVLAAEYGVSRQWVSHVMRRAMDRLKPRLISAGLSLRDVSGRGCEPRSSAQR